MNEFQSHVEYVTENYTDKAAALALVDRFAEDFHESHVRALRYVARIRRDQKNAHEMTRAGNLLAARSWVRGPIFADMLMRCGEVPDECSASALVVPGSRPPYIQATGYEDLVNRPHHTIVVGARWVIDCAELVTLANEHHERAGRGLLPHTADK